jgi:hypothetical protein
MSLISVKAWAEWSGDLTDLPTSMIPGLFQCGCGQPHAPAHQAHIINWKPSSSWDGSTYWYLQCAFDHLLFFNRLSD